MDNISTSSANSSETPRGEGDTVRTASTSREYGAKNLLVLEGLEAVRKRPAMYIGSTDTRGLMHCLWEIFDNGVDEALAGYGRRITVTLEKAGSILVTDEGRGIPVDVEPRTGLSGLEVVYTKLHAGGKFGGGAYNVSGGLHGVGASVVNAVSVRLDVEVDRKSTVWGMSFRRGVPGVFEGEGPDAPFTPGSGVRKVGKAKRGVTGTRVRYWPDRQIFLPDAKLSWSKLADRARQTAFLVPGLEIVITDERGIQTDPETGDVLETVSETMRFDGGISEFAEYLATDQPVNNVMRLQGETSFTETVPMLDENGGMTPTDVDRDLGVDIALRWGTGYDTTVRSFVNIIATPKGGTHVQGFEQGLLRAFSAGLEGTRILKSSEEIVKDDVLEGMTAVVTVSLAEPQFEGQTKEVLGTPPVRRLVARIVEDKMTAFLTSAKAADKPVARALMEKVVNASRTRVAARAHKENQRRKNALESSHLPPKLKDCRSSDPDVTELFIVEGDSALGTANVARNSEHQALLPIRGKILNVQKADLGAMLKNAECASIIQVVGAGSGKTFDLDQARYGKVIFMADADSDGAHIRCLLATLFFRYMRPMVEAGRVFSAVPPLHRFELINPKRGMDKYLYTYTDADYQRTAAQLAKKGVRFKEPQRYKGLGEMDASQLKETTMDPRHRTLRRITVDDAAEAEGTFEILMGNEVAPRKQFIVEGAYRLDAEQIDA
ncbi:MULTISPECIES: DNA gyrase/topoisomerase IV subunit B [Cutibacterium]|jgi:DNA gyrase, B subunit, C-terminal domain protein|uniref:DNA topoisomerase (ATP-hydrolyzing) n=1 Tax=Cutibacterium acnes TaxID=1747 RepID=A0AA44U4K7_CUTAC|nr:MULTISPECIES: DNA topoisomerase IV subunit B [Cutibacterium]MBX7474156.1 type IIA DNA topoisomerase subunit B [Streptomyces sp. MAG02]OFJ81702.1 DNA topoisomerase IV subunit B [Propionibacterium sp. HMSC065F07]OFK52723.1 DNA topoisomerase IV subunit B [Propionibacterium sp. HMSC069G10]OFL46460.1 DNA topoisomerase IV subunit B [Propionibacterium sp. HMSC068C01]OFP49806.1 DNA topoisomerase IV subunit B [Propionibacterium sp. HMSC067A01]OFQ66590.1 DNA topoisomerase IV subunit B [Propionibacte